MTDSHPTPLDDAALGATWAAAWSALGRPAPAGLQAELMTAWFEPQRRGPIDAPRRAEIADGLSALPVRVDSEPLSLTTIDRLAATHGLSAYDAAYLELSLRRSLTLVSLDAQLVAAAKGLGHPVITAPTAGAT